LNLGPAREEEMVKKKKVFSLINSKTTVSLYIIRYCQTILQKGS